MPINKSALKTYAPKARKDFIAAMIARAARFGISKSEIVDAREQGDVVIIGADAFPRKVGAQRRKLIARIKLHGFNQTMEEVAYTWFNRLLAIRYMELHGYLDHGYRVLSHPAGKELPEILEHAEHLDFAGLNKNKVIDLKLDGTKDAELYRLLLIAQCNALNTAMPFLFERIDDETELLLPDNLLHTDSLIRKLVMSIDEADWREIEIIGWLYQFYISEKKDQVIGKVVKSEDIPAATQLFTPNWIVKYMVQNSLGAQWLATYPDSPLKAQMEYYIEPAEQTEDVQNQLDDIAPKELNPEELTLMDPACGSGHILVEAYDLFKVIYLERGYRLRDVPRLILEKNLYGLDIDTRAAQMAGFALLMKARADDRRILLPDNTPILNVMAIQDSNGLDAEGIARTLMPEGRFELVPSDELLPEAVAQPVLSGPEHQVLESRTIQDLVSLFKDAQMLGSLILTPRRLLKVLSKFEDFLRPEATDDMYVAQAKGALRNLVRQATMLGEKYTAIVANPPYMGGKGMNPALKHYLEEVAANKSDLYAAFLEVSFDRIQAGGRFGFMTPFTWLSLQSFKDVRASIIDRLALESLVLPEYHSFFDSAYVPVCAFSGQNTARDSVAVFFDLGDFYGADKQPTALLSGLSAASCPYRFTHKVSDFRKIPDSIIAPKLSETALACFDSEASLGSEFALRQGLITGDNERFLRFWHEIDIRNFSVFCGEDEAKWFPHQKGGEYRKWYGNNTYVVNWANGGEEIKNFFGDNGRLRSRPQNTQFYFLEGATWTSLTVASFAMRYVPKGHIYDAKGPMCIVQSDRELSEAICLSNSKVSDVFLRVLAPTMDYSQGPVGGVPMLEVDRRVVAGIFEEAVEITKDDWDSSELSWDFQYNPLLQYRDCTSGLQAAYQRFVEECEAKTVRLKDLEQENNREFISSYGLGDELYPQIQLEEVSLFANPRYRYGRDLNDRDRKAKFFAETIRELISYSVGCMMGRFSIEKPGLIYACAGNERFDLTKFNDFLPDDDGIVPITEVEWFDDDAAVRFEEFLQVAWSSDVVRENLRFVAEGLAPNGGNDPQKTIRAYFSKSFFKNHLKTYKKRPIYWLFSSGKLKAFECLVYLHRYNEGTLSRMRMEYVTPLQSRMAARIDSLEDDIATASSSAARTKAQKEKDLMVKQLEELRAFDEELRHYADQRITLDLDDGVKVNYGKFGNLLAERKAITGEKG